MKTKFEFHIKLTPEQIAKLQPAMDASEAEAEMDRLGSIFCQLYRPNDGDFDTKDDEFYIIGDFIENKYAEILDRVIAADRADKYNQQEKSS